MLRLILFIATTAFFFQFPLSLPSLAQEESSYHPLGKWSMVTSKYGYRRNPFNKRGKMLFHKGIDLAIKVGDPVFSWRSGTVVYTGWSKISGNIVNVKHEQIPDFEKDNRYAQPVQQFSTRVRPAH